MKLFKSLLASILIICILPVAIANSNSPAGIWTTFDDKTGKKRATVELTITGGVLSGRILHVESQVGDTGMCMKCPGQFKNKPVQGLQFLWGLKSKGRGVWGGGKILDAKNGKIYNAKLKNMGHKLLVRGYVGVSMLGRTQIWVRE